MSIMELDLARANHNARLAEAEVSRRANRAASVRRLQRRAARLSHKAERVTRRAERVASQARFVAARVL